MSIVGESRGLGAPEGWWLKARIHLYQVESLRPGFHPRKWISHQPKIMREQSSYMSPCLWTYAHCVSGKPIWLGAHEGWRLKTHTYLYQVESVRPGFPHNNSLLHQPKLIREKTACMHLSLWTCVHCVSGEPRGWVPLNVDDCKLKYTCNEMKVASLDFPTETYFNTSTT